jgi:hypothetical protein
MIVTACAPKSLPSAPTDPPLEAATAIPVVEPTLGSPTTDPAELAAAAVARADLEDWVAQLNDVEPDAAGGLAAVVDAYDGGSTEERSAALDTWVTALEGTDFGWSPPFGPKSNPYSVGCWGRIADLYAAQFQSMEEVAGDLSDEISFGPTSPGLDLPGHRLSPRDALRNLESGYDGSRAGELGADEIERFCTPGTVAAAPLPTPGMATELEGVRFGDPFILGGVAFVLAENTTDRPVELGASLGLGPGGTIVAFNDAAGRRLEGIYVPTIRWVGPHETVAVSLYGSGGGPPKGWKTARVEPGVASTTDPTPQLRLYKPGGMWTSLGLLVSARVENVADTKWCAAVTAIAMNHDQIVAGGWEDIDCAEQGAGWVDVIRLEGWPEAVDALYVELSAASAG